MKLPFSYVGTIVNHQRPVLQTRVIQFMEHRTILGYY